MFGIFPLKQPIAQLVCYMTIAIYLNLKAVSKFESLVRKYFNYEKNRVCAMASRSKHYTPIEKNIFLQILKKYTHVIESKKSNSNTLREKEVAWKEICTEFNNSSMITEERNMQQLKKLWTNLKQAQRNILTKERQKRFSTGGGSEIQSTELDPDVAAIAPNLMHTAPMLFTSNMDNTEIEDTTFKILESIEASNSDDEENICTINNAKFVNNETTCYASKDKSDTVGVTMENVLTNVRKRNVFANSTKENIIDYTVKKQKISTETEGALKMQRMKNIMEQDKRLGEIKLKHEERMNAIKEAHLKEINNLELRAYLAKAKLAELMLAKEENNSA